MFDAITRLKDCGINYPCCQLMDMNYMYLVPLAKQNCGLEYRENKIYLTGDLLPPQKPIALKQVLFLQKYKKIGFDGIKFPVTGPITLSGKILIRENQPLLNYFPELLVDLGKIVGQICKFFVDTGIEMITIDEPALTYAMGFLSKELILESIEEAIKPIKNQTISSIHVCGDLDPLVVELLLETSADYLSHAFMGYKNNLSFFTKSNLATYNKMLGFGCIETNFDKYIEALQNNQLQPNMLVESKKNIKKFILSAGERLGLENLILTPDCGFGSWTYFKEDAITLVFQKIRNMVQARDDIAKEFL
jgi:methionine synthase II (cobalamin-independent)